MYGGQVQREGDQGHHGYGRDGPADDADAEGDREYE
jgi:hypothetical protein